MEERPRLSDLTPDQLLAMAAQYRRMAASASTNEVMQSLLELARRYEKLAEERSKDRPT